MMAKSKVYLIGAIGLVLGFFSCKNTTETKAVSNPSVFEGKFVKSIHSDKVYLRSGDSIVFPVDSIDKVFYLIRHAEKDTTNKADQDPNLTADGLNRAAILAKIMIGTRVDAIYSTLKMRALYTVDSLADVKGMSVLPYDNKTLKPALDSIKTSKDYNRILMVGHSNTIPSITNSLANKDIYTKPWSESEYDNFIIVISKKSGASDVYKLKY